MDVVPARDGFGNAYTWERMEVPGGGPAGDGGKKPSRVGPNRYCDQATDPGLARIEVACTSTWTRGSNGTWSKVSTQSRNPSPSKSRSIGGEPDPVLPSWPKPAMRRPSARKAGRVPSGRIGITSRIPSRSTSAMSGGQNPVESTGARASWGESG